ncbi:macrosialin-like [Cetorhinus maximus]
MPLAIFLCLFLFTLPVANGDVKCEGQNCRPRPTQATLQPPTVISPQRPVTLLPPSTPGTPHTTPANLTTPTPANHTTPTPANHTTLTPANHTTHTPANHTTATPTNHTTATPTNHTTATPANHTTATPANHTTATPANHTTATPANHTTATPANHTTHAVLPTSVHPTAPPVLESGSYNVTGNKEVCAMAHLKLQVRVQYQTAKKKMCWGLFFVEPKKTSSSGSCGPDYINMTLTFPEGFLMFGFKKNTTKQTFYLKEIQSKLRYKFPGTTATSVYTGKNSSVMMLQTHIGYSYRCSKESVMAKSNFWVDLVDEQIQAFKFFKNGQFGAAEDCPADKRVPVVAIVVVVILIVLIIVVLLAYLIGRKRHPAGYQSI